MGLCEWVTTQTVKIIDKNKNKNKNLDSRTQIEKSV
jgi:hypothetical protein